MSVPCEEIRPELEALLASMTDGALDANGKQRLARILREHPDARQFYFDYCQMHALLTSAHGVLHALEAPRRRRLHFALAAAAAILVAVGASLWWRTSGSTGVRVIATEGAAVIVRDGREIALREAGGGVREGDRLSTGAGGRTVVHLRDKARIVLVDRTEAEFRKEDVQLKAGLLQCSVVPQTGGRSVVFSMPHGKATVLGTDFELAADPNETRLRTNIGRVLLSAGGRGVEVKGGELGTADAQGVARWVPVCDLDFTRMKELPAQMEAWFCLSASLETAGRKVEPAADRVRLADGGLVLAPAPRGGHKHGLVEARWKEEVGDDLVIEADVAGGAPWSLGFAVSGNSFEGYRVICAALNAYPNGMAVDTLHPAECVVLARDPRPISFDKDHTLRVERRGARLRVWVDRDLRIDTEIDHPLAAGRRRTFSLSNFGSPPVVRALRVWKAAAP